MWEREWIDKIQAISLGKRESGEEQIFYNFSENILQKSLWVPPLGKVKSEIKIIVHKASAMKKV